MLFLWLMVVVTVDGALSAHPGARAATSTVRGAAVGSTAHVGPCGVDENDDGMLMRVAMMCGLCAACTAGCG